MEWLVVLVPCMELTEVELWPELELLAVQHVRVQLLSKGLLPSLFLGPAMDGSVLLELGLEGHRHG